jgi:hypothetical protein
MSQIQQYWLPGYGLSRQIVLGQIQYFLGPSATVRPYTYQVNLRHSLKDPFPAPYEGSTHPNQLLIETKRGAKVISLSAYL